LVLSRGVSTDEQEKDELCLQYTGYENFWTDEDGISNRQRCKEQPRVVILVRLGYTVLTCYYELPFTAHQNVSRTVESTNRKYWRKTLRNSASKYIKKCELMQEGRQGIGLLHPWEMPW